jgi:hypothetical protein
VLLTKVRKTQAQCYIYMHGQAGSIRLDDGNEVVLVTSLHNLASENAIGVIGHRARWLPNLLV